MLRFLLILFTIVFTHATYAQSRVTFFYDSTWSLNSKEEASFFRNAILDTAYYKFIGQVLDYYSDGKPEMKGQYIVGMKSGLFTFFYPNGQKKMEGEFVEDEMVGIWKYYYSDGSPKQTIEFTDNDFKILSYHDRGGTEKVKNRDGLWEGAVYIPESGDSMFVAGEVANGLKEGWWTYFNVRGITAYEEKYRKGTFKIGKKYSKTGKYTGANDKPIGKQLLIPTKLSYTEKFIYAPDVEQSDYPYLKFLPDEKTIYFDKNWQLCRQEQAMYYRNTNVINIENPTGSFTDYYMNTRPYRSGRFVNSKKYGAFVYYHENGGVESRGIFENDKKKGEWQYFYTDGSLKQIIIYQEGRSYVYSYWDESGIRKVDQGTGLYQTEKDYISGTLREEGKLLDFEKTGTWKGFTSQGTLFYEEKYKNGNLIEGYSFDSAGNKVSYTQKIIQAGPAEGVHEFYYFINQKIKYPNLAQTNSIEGKVLLEFDISQEGDILNTKTISSPHELLSKEALRVVNMYDKWKAGQEMGQPVRMSFIVSINFSLSENPISSFN